MKGGSKIGNKAFDQRKILAARFTTSCLMVGFFFRVDPDNPITHFIILFCLPTDMHFDHHLGKLKCVMRCRELS